VHIEKNNLGAVIKAARMKKGWTQDTLAETVGVGVRHIMGIENEGNSPSYEVLYKVIRGLNIPADNIFYPEKNSPGTQLDYLIHLLEQCGDNEISAVTALLETLLHKKDK
jgi:transcriptional regulator with XRE-family HTH domain